MSQESKPWNLRWDIIKEIGTFGQGTTYLARDRESESSGVIKCLKNPYDKQARKRMRFEVDALRLLSDKGAVVPRVLETNVDKADDDHTPLFFAMEYIDGQTLQEYVELHAGLPLAESLDFIAQIAKTISIGHTEGVLHRDLKPKNVMVRVGDDGSKEIVVLDYGLSFNQTSEGCTRKTENIWNEFLSLPELNIEGGDRRDQRTDVTHLCGLLFYCLSARNPQLLRDAEERMPHQRPDVTYKDVTDESDGALLLSALFTRGFRQRPNDRFQTVEDFISSIEAIRHSQNGADASLATLAQRESQLLRQHDRITQLEQLKPRLPGLYGQLVAAIGRAYRGQDLDLFKVDTRGQELHTLESTALMNLDLVHSENRVWIVTIPPHDKRRELSYGLGLLNGELVVLRYLRNRNPGTFETPSILTSFLIENTIDFSEVVLDFKSWLRSSMRELRSEVLPTLTAGKG